MINISKLYCGQVTPGDWIRYGKKDSGERAGDIVPKEASERRPIVVWNITRACNLKCVHCYNDSGSQRAEDELSMQEAKEVLQDLAGFGVPSVLFSGGEPLLRKDLFEFLDCGRLFPPTERL
jgi:pyruvate-formate lyase-activating enzyme